MQTQTTTSSGMIDRWQIKMLHVLKSKLQLTEDEYRRRVEDMSVFGRSCKDLTFEEAEMLIALWRGEAIEKGVWKEGRRRPGGFKKKYENLGRRPGMGTPAQLRMIEGMWSDVSRYNHAVERERALRAFIAKRYKVSDITFLSSRDVCSVVKALESMKADATKKMEEEMGKRKYQFCNRHKILCEHSGNKPESEKCRDCSSAPAKTENERREGKE